MFVKRVIGVGGDVVKIEDKKVFSTGSRCSSLTRNSSIPPRCLCGMTFRPPLVCWKPSRRLGTRSRLGAGNAQLHSQ